MASADEKVVRRLLELEGRTYAEESGIGLKDSPQPLYQLVVLAMLLSARISSGIAVAAARELFAAGCRTPEAMAKAGWQDRVDALGRGGYRRYDERTATMLGEGAQLLRDKYRGDVRRLREEADGKVSALRRSIKQVPGIADVGADIFFREAQGLWPELRPFLDKKAASGAERLGLPTSTDSLTKLVGSDDLSRLTAALVRVSLDKQAAQAVREAARSG